jgi:hypothetical protein
MDERVTKESTTKIFILTAMALQVFAADKYPLTMTAVFTEGKARESSRTAYHSGDYDCTTGDEHYAPVCHTPLEWAELESVGGTPNTVAFTLEDGARVGVQSDTVINIHDYVKCMPTSNVVFCTLYFEMLAATQVSIEKAAKYGQTVVLSSEEYTAAIAAKHRELFGDRNVMTVHFRYRLKGKAEKDRFQRIEVDPHICPSCKLVHLMNSHGDGYYKR